jgi:hypothetical protein
MTLTKLEVAARQLDAAKRTTWIVFGWLTLLETAQAEGNFKERIEMQCGPRLFSSVVVLR